MTIDQYMYILIFDELKNEYLLSDGESLEKLEDDDKINLIITLESKGLMDYYDDDSKGYNTLSEYLNSRSVSSVVKNMISNQKNFAT